jgi:hypothetical protein
MDEPANRKLSRNGLVGDQLAISSKPTSGPGNQGSSHEPVIRVDSSHLKNRAPLQKEQTASRRSVENKQVASFTTLPYSFEPRSQLFVSHRAQS